jgi:hypothetical protein
VNAFGHAVAASWQSRDGAFLLGAMLPDLATLVGGRLARVREPGLAAGVRHHVLTDECFHAMPGFRSWEAEAAAQLREAGLRRHAARAAAHVAIELTLDGELAREPAHAAVHESAMEAARERDEPPWRRAPSGDWCGLIERLSEAGPPRHLSEPRVVAARVEHALGRRPRLAVAGAESRALAAWLDAEAAPAAARAAALSRELERALPA